MTAEELFSQLLSELCIEITFHSFQKQMTINSTCPHCNQQCELLNEKAGLDIYGNKIDSSGVIITSNSGNLSSTANSANPSAADSTTSNSGMITVECPCCKKFLAAARFAPHLEKCMGMGRQSARKRGNLMMKMAAGSENESDDASENVQVTRTPALQINDDSFTAAAAAVAASGGSEPKKTKLSPTKAGKTSGNTPASGSNSKSNSPSKAKRAPATTANNTTPSKAKPNKK